LQPIDSAENDLSIPGNAITELKFSVAVTGDVFRWMIDYGNEDVLNKVRAPIR
jgi:cation-transporting ATPase 13A3/4/5